MSESWECSRSRPRTSSAVRKSATGRPASPHMWRNLRPYPDAKLQPWPPPSASGRGGSLHDAFAVRRLIQPRLSERQPSSRVGDGEREARGRVEPGCRHRRHRSARVAPCRIAEATSQARGPSSVAALVTKESSRGGRAHDRSSGKGVAGVGRRRRGRSWQPDSEPSSAENMKAVVRRGVAARSGLGGSDRHAAGQRALPFPTKDSSEVSRPRDPDVASSSCAGAALGYGSDRADSGSPTLAFGRQQQRGDGAGLCFAQRRRGINV